MSNQPADNPHRDAKGNRAPDEWLENLLRSELNDRATGERPVGNMADLAIKKGHRIRRHRRLAATGAAASVLALAGVTSVYAVDLFDEGEGGDPVADSETVVEPHAYEVGLLVEGDDGLVIHPGHEDRRIPVSMPEANEVIQAGDTYFVMATDTDDDMASIETVSEGTDVSEGSTQAVPFEFTNDDVVVAEHADMAAVVNPSNDLGARWLSLVGSPQDMETLPDLPESELGSTEDVTIPLDFNLIGWDEENLVLETHADLMGQFDTDEFLAGDDLFTSQELIELRRFGSDQIMVSLDPRNEANVCLIDLDDGERYGGPNSDRDACLAQNHSHLDPSDPRFDNGFEFAQEMIADASGQAYRDWASESVHDGVSGQLFSDGANWTIFVPYEGDEWYLQPEGEREWKQLDVPEGSITPIEVRR